MITPRNFEDTGPVSDTALAHELGHWFGLDMYHKTADNDPNNIMYPDNENDGTSGHRKGQKVTDEQQATVREEALKYEKKVKALKDPCGFETPEPSGDVPSFIDITYTSVWTDGLLLHLGLAVDNYSSENCELGFEINSSGNSYFLGFNPAYNATIFRTNGVDGNTSLVDYKFEYTLGDLAAPGVISGISLTLPLFKLSPSPIIYYKGIGKYGATVDTAPEVHSIQIPNGVLSNQYLLSRTGMPVTLDPALARDTASGEIIQNVYQTLIWYGNKHPITFTPGVGHNLTDSEYADLGNFTPVLATSVPTTANGGVIINASGSYWKFTINPNAQFTEWTAGNGTVMPARNVTADDVVYSFQRQMVIDCPSGPSWMLFEPALGTNGWSAELGDGPYSTYDNGTFKNTADEIAAGISITSWCYKGPGPNDVTFHFQNAWNEVTMNQILRKRGVLY